MAGFFKASSASIASAVASDDDFADYSTPSVAPAAAAEPSFSPLSFASSTPAPASPWYAVWERHSLSEFKSEGWILFAMAVVVIAHIWGSKRNRAIATGFIATIAPVLSKEFSQVGFSKQAKESEDVDADKIVKANSNQDFVSYATGRNNVAFLNTTIKLQRRNNPVAWFIEAALGFFFEALATTSNDSVTMILCPFDGADPTTNGKTNSNSKYDNFVWAIVNKKHMRRWREERYDLSLTRTSDWESLPNWLAVMGESKEIGDTCLYNELKEIVKECGSFLEFLLVSDMPKEKPTKLSELTPRKRITLELTLPPSSVAPETVQRLVQAFIRLADHLAANAHFRPEVLRKVKATREDETRKLKKAIEEETKEERELKLAEKKKELRDAKLRSMSAAEQKKFLEKEREKERKDAMKKQSRKA